jgi:hypothetical protein
MYSSVSDKDNTTVLPVAFGGFITWPHLADLAHGRIWRIYHMAISRIFCIISGIYYEYFLHLFSPKCYAKDFAQILKESNLCKKVFSFIYAKFR